MSQNEALVASGISTELSTSLLVGRCGIDVPSAKTIPKNVVSTGTGARLAFGSGPRTATFTWPRCCQITSSAREVATDIILETAVELRLRHTRSIHGDSDARLSMVKPTPADSLPLSNNPLSSHNLTPAEGAARIVVTATSLPYGRRAASCSYSRTATSRTLLLAETGRDGQVPGGRTQRIGNRRAGVGKPDVSRVEQPY
ncbi:hypothetical protein GCM10027444_05460 [Actinopolyspora lacussalsi]